MYHVTPAGLEAFRCGVLQVLSLAVKSYPPLQLGLACLPGIAPSQRLAALCHRRDALADDLTQLQEKWQAQRPLPYFVEAMFDHSVTMIQAELCWIKRFIRQLEARNDQAGSAQRTEAPVPADK